MLQVPPWRNFRNFRCILTPFNIIIAKWGDDRKSVFRLKRPPKKFPVAFQATGNFQRRPEIGDFALDFLAKNISGPIYVAWKLQFSLVLPASLVYLSGSDDARGLAVPIRTF